MKQNSASKKIKILLINPPIKTEEVYGEYSSVAPSLPPLGFCYLAAVLQKNGYGNISIIDGVLEKLSPEGLFKKIKRRKPDIVGISSTTASFYYAEQTIALCKKANKKILTVLGGAHITALPRRTMEEYPDLDIGVYGEGELTFLELINKISQKKNLGGIRGIVRRKKGKVTINPPRELIKNLDDLPFPARNLLKDLRLYRHTPLRGRRFTTSMITSRGCPFNCSFCDQSVFGRTWRGHSANYVIKEISHLKQKYNVDFISFEDDNFLLSRKRAMQICQGIIDNKLKLEWGCSARADDVDKELLCLMKKSGCFNIFIGIESGSPRVLKLLNKKMQLKNIARAVRLIKEAGINAYGSVILGIPSETETEMKRTISFILSLPLDGISVFLYTPYPNTKLAEMAPRYGIVSHHWQDYSLHPRQLSFIPYGMTGAKMLNFQRLAYLKFYARPKFLLEHPHLLFERRIWKNGLRIFKNFVMARC